MNLSGIIICGDNSGIKTIYDGLVSFFEAIHIYTNTPEVLSLRSCDRLIDGFAESDFEYVLSSAYAPLIDAETLATKKFLNIHYALLPRFRGMHPVVWGILNNEKYLGWTLHEMDVGMDSGPVIYQYKSPNEAGKTATDYMQEFHRTVTEQIGPVVRDFIKGKIRSQPQPSEGIVWGAKRNLNDCQIDFNWDLEFLARFFRALVAPYPLPFVKHKDRTLFITDHELYPADADVITLGRVCNIDDKGAWIKVRGGYLLAKEMTDQEGKVVDIRTTFRIGTRL